MVGSPGIVTGCQAPPRPAGSTSATQQMEQERHLRIEYRHRQTRHGELSSGDLDTFEPSGLLLGHTQTAFVERSSGRATWSTLAGRDDGAGHDGHAARQSRKRPLGTVAGAHRRHLRTTPVETCLVKD